MNLSTTKKPLRKKKQKKLTPEERFQQQWQRVQALKDDNARIETEVETFAKRIEERILEEEKIYANAMAGKIEHLLRFAEKKSLSNWQREELFSWLRDSIESLASHPFSTHINIEALAEKYNVVLNTYLDRFNPEPSADLPENQDGNDKKDNKVPDDVSMDDMFTESLESSEMEDNEDDNDGDDEDYGFDDFFDKFFGGEGVDEQKQNERQELDRLLKSTSITKMFRKIAKVLHPDREQDETLKEEKNKLMGELTKARDDKDIIKIFAMYTEYVGEAPLDLDKGELEKLTALLKYQAEQLQHEQEHIIYRNPRHGQIYERFYGVSEKELNADIKQHIEQLRENIEHDRLFVASITSLQKLKPILQARYEESHYY